MDTQTLIHVGTELVVIGGLTFWLNKRISSLETIIGSLEHKLSSYENIIQQQNQLINKHEQIFRELFGQKFNKPNVPDQPPIKLDQNVTQQIPKTEQTKPPGKNIESQHNQNDITPEELDKFLKRELQDLNNEPKVMEINDESTILKETNNKSNRIKKKTILKKQN